MAFEKEISEMKGIISPLFTPFHRDNSINFEMLLAVAEFQLSAGIDGFFLTGSTGEGLLLSENERASIFECVAGEFSERATLIAHVGHPSTDIASRLAKSASDCGVDWISSVAPIYHGTSFEAALRHYDQIAKATHLPFMIYSLGGVIDPRRDAAFFELPNVCGIKFTGANLFSVQQLVRFVDRPITVMNGFDEQLVAGLSMGLHGGIGTTYNFAPKLYCDLYKSFNEGNITRAMELQFKINSVTELMAGYENWSYRKAIMKYIGFDCGHARPPYAPLSDREYQEYADQLDALNVLTRND